LRKWNDKYFRNVKFEKDINDSSQEEFRSNMRYLINCDYTMEIVLNNINNYVELMLESDEK
jgi:hypothetical protein